MEQAKQPFPNLFMSNEKIKNIYNQLKAIVDELKDLGVLVNENLANFQQELESVHQFCQGDYKFSFLIQGEMNAGKSTWLNALLGERVVAVSSVPETNFLTCVIPDRGFETPMLYKVPLSKIYNSNTSSFHVNEADLEFNGVSGAENIYKHLNGSNRESREKLKEMIKKAQENQESNQDMDQKAKELYKDAELHDTVYVIKCRIPWLEEKIKDEFILKRIQFIDFPGMFEYGHKKISEIYKVFEDNSQGAIHILHPLGYQSKAITKLQNYKKYPNRMLIIVNKMDQINLNEEDAEDEEENDRASLDVQKKADRLVENFEDFLRQNSENASDDAQKTKYSEMSKEVKTIINFMAAKEETMKQYALRYRKSKTELEKDLWDRILKESVEDDQTYDSVLQEAQNQNKPFAEMDLFEYFIEKESNLFEKLQDNLKHKFLNRFGELVTQDMPRKLNSIREQLINMIEKIVKQQDVNSVAEQKHESDNTHSFVRCDGCQAHPIIGVRYNCKVCEDFDFCETCKQTKQHPEHEFQVIPKEDLKSYMYDFCAKNTLASCKTIDNFREQFTAHLMELFFSLGEIFKTGSNDKAVETLLKTQCTRYKTLKEETAAKIEQIQEEVAGFGSLIAFKWGTENGLIALLAGIEAEKIMMSLFDSYNALLALLLTGCAHLFQAIVTTTMKKPSTSLIQPFYEGVEDLSALVKNPYEMKAKITKSSELVLVTSKWQNTFQSFYAVIDKDLKDNTQSAIQNLEIDLFLGSIFKIEFEDEEKSKELLEKLDGVLQKVKSIKQI